MYSKSPRAFQTIQGNTVQIQYRRCAACFFISRFLSGSASARNRHTLNAVAFRGKRTAQLCTFPVFIKSPLCFVRISVDLPAADTFAAASLVPDKAADILRRIA
jgi:hypothetical protein